MALMNKNQVHRPVGHWTKQVHKFLHFLRAQGFNQAPLPLRIDGDGLEVLSYVNGETCDYPMSFDVKSPEALVSSAKLLRRLHDVSQKFIIEGLAPQEGWMFPCRNSKEVICHNDFAPYNICFAGKQAVGIIDFDTAHPGPRAWDVAYALYRFAPFTHPDNEDGFGTLQDQISRACLFCDAYGLQAKEFPNTSLM
jgi:hypothetical protein